MDIGPNACIDWTNADWIYFVRIFNHITLARINVASGQTETIGWFPVGATQLSVSSRADSLRGVAVLDYWGGAYEVSTFDYRVFLIHSRPGCLGRISPGGTYYTVGPCPGDTASYHTRLSVYSWDGGEPAVMSSPQGEFFNRGNWSVNSNDWLVMSAGRGPELLKYHDMVLIARDMSQTIRVTANDSGAYDEASDFWVGDPDVPMTLAGSPGATSALSPGRAGARPNEGAAERDGDYTVECYTPNGKLLSRGGMRTHGAKSPGIAAGLYVVRVIHRGYCRAQRVVVRSD
jgi:hypothetical protein